MGAHAYSYLLCTLGSIYYTVKDVAEAHSCIELILQASTGSDERKYPALYIMLRC